MSSKKPASRDKGDKKSRSHKPKRERKEKPSPATFAESKGVCPVCGEAVSDQQDLDEHYESHGELRRSAAKKQSTHRKLLALAIGILRQAPRNTLGVTELCDAIWQHKDFAELKTSVRASTLLASHRFLYTKHAKKSLFYDGEADAIVLRGTEADSDLVSMGSELDSKAGDAEGDAGSDDDRSSAAGGEPGSASLSRVPSSLIDDPALAAAAPAAGAVVGAGAAAVLAAAAAAAAASVPAERKSAIVALEAAKPKKPTGPVLTREAEELYCLALAHIIATNHNGNKNGPVGLYTYRKKQRASLRMRHDGPPREPRDPRDVRGGSDRPDASPSSAARRHRSGDRNHKPAEPAVAAATASVAAPRAPETKAAAAAAASAASSADSSAGGAAAGAGAGSVPAATASASGASSSSSSSSSRPAWRRMRGDHSSSSSSSKFRHNLHYYQLDRDTYNGHNIAAIAVNMRTGKVIGCEFNHCILLKSTTAHAEERLIDYLFKTAETCGLELGGKYSDFLRDVLIVTSLEPCYQCAGKMLMAGVRRCIWLQDDPLIRVKIMSEVSARDPGFQTSSALAQDVCDFPFSKMLSESYAKWRLKAKEYPFFMRTLMNEWEDVEDEEQVSRSSTVPTFLCCDDALDIYQAASQRFLVRTETLVKTGKQAQESKAAADASAAAAAAATATGGSLGSGSGLPALLPVQAPSLSRALTHGALGAGGGGFGGGILHVHVGDVGADLSDLAAHLRKVAMHSFSPQNYNRGAHHT